MVFPELYVTHVLFSRDDNSMGAISVRNVCYFEWELFPFVESGSKLVSLGENMIWNFAFGFNLKSGNVFSVGLSRRRGRMGL